MKNKKYKIKASIVVALVFFSFLSLTSANTKSKVVPRGHGEAMCESKDFFVHAAAMGEMGLEYYASMSGQVQSWYDTFDNKYILVNAEIGITISGTITIDCPSGWRIAWKYITKTGGYGKVTGGEVAPGHIQYTIFSTSLVSSWHVRVKMVPIGSVGTSATTYLSAIALDEQDIEPVTVHWT